MSTNRTPFHITWRELIVATLIIVALIVILHPWWTYGIPRGVRANATAKTGKAIYNWLQAYANNNNDQFPDARQSSNEAFRQLFIKRYLDDEQGFGISNDPWLNNAPGGNKKPDNDIGQVPDFTQALQPGECSWAYVTGLSLKSDPGLPIMANAFSESIGVYSKKKNQKGGVFLGQKAIWISVGGSTKVADLKENLMIMEKKSGHDVNVFREEWGTNQEQVKNPAG